MVLCLIVDDGPHGYLALDAELEAVVAVTCRCS
jgi:hypothetical protein